MAKPREEMLCFGKARPRVAWEWKGPELSRKALKRHCIDKQSAAEELGIDGVGNAEAEERAERPASEGPRPVLRRNGVARNCEGKAMISYAWTSDGWAPQGPAAEKQRLECIAQEPRSWDRQCTETAMDRREDDTTRAALAKDGREKRRQSGV